MCGDLGPLENITAARLLGSVPCHLQARSENRMRPAGTTTFLINLIIPPRAFRIRHAKKRLNCAGRLGDRCFVYFACSQLYVLLSYFVILSFSSLIFFCSSLIPNFKAVNIYLPLASYIQVVSRYQNATALISNASDLRIFYLSTSACLCCGR